MFTTMVAMIVPFFNNIVGLIGAATFWPITVYFPVEMYMSRAEIPKFSLTWIGLKLLSWACLIVTIIAVAASIQGIVTNLGIFKPFHSVS